MFGALLTQAAKAVASKDIDLIPGVGFNEAERQREKEAAAKKAGSKQTSSGNLGTPADPAAAAQPDYAGGSGGGGTDRDVAAEGFYEQGINQTQDLINNLSPREQSALNSILRSYEVTRGRQDVAFGDNQADYTKNVDKTLRNDARKKTQIDTDVRNDMSSFQRLLGSRGAGSSSAARELVPTAVAMKGSSERADASQVTADNKDALDTNFNRYKREWEQTKADADTQYENGRKDISSQFAQQGIDARQKLIELQTNLASARGGDRNAIARAGSISSEIASLQQRISELADRASGRVVQTKDVAMEQAQNKDFNPDANTSTTQAEAGVDDESSVYYDPSIQKKSDEDLLKELYGIA